MEFLSHSSQETKNIAKNFAATLKGGDIVLLKGDLGAGKTTFTQGMAEEFGIKEPVTSPTFVGIQLYKTNFRSFVNTICHIDAYRFQSADDVISSGIEDYFDRTDMIIIVEWPEQLFGILKRKCHTIEFEHIDENSRKIEIED